MVALDPAALTRFPRFSLYNSPYVSHDRGCAVDLYPDGEDAPSPVAGEVTLTKTVRAPPKPYAPEHDHLLVVDTGDHLARMLHVKPAVEPGDCVEVGDPLGTLVRAGFFAPWVGNHVHLGFRKRDADPVRAAGSLPVDLPVDVEPVAWDGAGVVVERAPTYVVLDAPGHPAPGDRYAGVAADSGVVALDGGLPHYAGGGALGGTAGPVSLLGTVVGAAFGRDVEWSDVAVLANGEPITGLSLYCGRDDLRAKLVCPEWDAAIGDRVEVAIRERATT